MAFVLVQHLAPDHKSILTELIRRYTRMEVFEVEDEMKVRVNCAYIIPPGRDMALHDGHLQLLEPSAPRGLRLPIDFFFRSLAKDQGARAIGIVLSGTGSDGTAGIRAIKGEGGMVMAQDSSTTEFDGMPRSAMATGVVDYELPPAQMPAQLIAYTAQTPRIDVPPTAGNDETLKHIFVLLRSHTGHDFSLYKPSTVHRRIERRMAVHQVANTTSYLKFLQQTPAEVDALFRDMLIGVTNFFRDPAAFEALQGAIPRLFSGKPAGSTIRVWVPGCSTGEEAYSIAILLTEQVEALKQSYTLQVFATDIDSRAIATARAGRYPTSIAADVSPERLARYFTAVPGGGFRINKAIRDVLVFSEQDVLKDPPFSRLDLLSCRNLLIYLGPELQKRLLPLFFYALKPSGLLFLGTSEGVGDAEALFSVLDRKSKLFKRRDEQGHGPRASRFPIPLGTSESPLRPPRKVASPVKISAREITEQTLLQLLAPASALVNGQGDVVYLHGRTGMFLEPAPGEPGVTNILKMAREGLRTALATALHRSATARELVRTRGLKVKTNGHFTIVDLSVRPVGASAAATDTPLYLVMMEEAPQPIAVPLFTHAVAPGEHDTEARVAALQEELRAKEEYLQSTHEELESSAEELKSSNEEMQSVNEELQSTNEELETSKEELQSVNEELATVNNELQTKVIELSQANNDMNNLLAGTGIGTVFVDHQLRILRFTPAAYAITNLIPTDVGRPVGQIVSNLVGYDRLVPDVQEVLNTLQPREVDVQSTRGRWFTLRIQPYRTIDNVIEGAVMSFTDITETVRTREALRKVNEVLRLAVVVRDASDALTVQDLKGRILAWNPGAVRLFGWTEAEALAMHVQERIPPAVQAQEEEHLQRLARGEVLAPYSTQRVTKAGTVLEVSVVCTALLDAAGKVYAIATTERPETNAGRAP